jgi:drug/metabolite transporter (DMT)-like permease
VSRRTVVLFAAVSVVWGSSFLFIKIAVEDVSPAVVAFARAGLGAAVLLPLTLARGSLRSLRGRIGAIAVLAVLDVAGPFLLTAWGEQHVSSSLAGILTSTDPLFVALLALRFDASERVDGVRALGLLVGIVGVVALLGLDVAGDGQALLGAAAVLLSALGYAGAALFYKRHFADDSPLAVVTGALALSAVMLLVPALATLPPSVPAGDTFAALGVLGAANTGLAFWMFYALIDRAGATRASVITYVMPAVAVLLGVAFLSEPFTLSTAVGLALILGGSALATVERQRRRSYS